MSIDIVTRWLNLPYTTVRDVLMSDGCTELVVTRGPPLLTCSGCGQLSFERYDRTRQRIRDLNVFETYTYLLLDKWRLNCPSCGVRVEDVGFAAPHSRCTRRFEDYVARLCQHMPVASVAELLGLDWKTVKEIDKRALERQFAVPNYTGLRLLAIDDIAYKKKYKFLTVVLDVERTSVVWVAKGRGRATLEAFFDEIGPGAASRLEAIAIDMWEPYIAAIQAKAPQAAIVFDKFHVIRYYSRVIDRVRLDEFNKAGAEGKAVVRVTKYLLLKNRGNLSDKQENRLRELLALNENLNTVYVLKDDLKRLWDCSDRHDAMRVLDEWTHAVEQSKIEPLCALARMLQRYSYGLLNHCDYPINTARLEGLNNKIKVIKRRCYGFHDLDYFALKIKQAAPRGLSP